MHDADSNALDDGRTAVHLTRMILDYLAEHPQAMDTVEGIAEWWILRHQARVVTARVARVLAQLTARGLLEKFGTGESSRYRLRQHPSACDARLDHDPA